MPVFHKGNSQNINRMEVKYCNFCQYIWHSEDVCHKKLPDLAKQRSVQKQTMTNSSSKVEVLKPATKRKLSHQDQTYTNNNP